MARNILDAPSEKMKPIVKSILKLGLHQHAVSSTGSVSIKKKTLYNLKSLTSKFLLFDWEFFCNELEYE